MAWLRSTPSSRKPLEAPRIGGKRLAEIDARALGDHGDAVDRLFRLGGHGEVIVDHGRHLFLQRLGAQIGGEIEQPLGDLGKRAIAGERQIFRLEIVGDQLLGALGGELPVDGRGKRRAPGRRRSGARRARAAPAARGTPAAARNSDGASAASVPAARAHRAAHRTARYRRSAGGSPSGRRHARPRPRAARSRHRPSRVSASPKHSMPAWRNSRGWAWLSPCGWKRKAGPL